MRKTKITRIFRFFASTATISPIFSSQVSVSAALTLQKKEFNKTFRYNYLGDFESQLYEKFQDFVNAHNEYLDNKIDSDGIEFTKRVKGTDGKSYLYVDFNGHNGDMIIDDEWHILNLNNKGEYVDIEDFEGEIIFDVESGFLCGADDCNLLEFHRRYDDEIETRCSDFITNSGTDEKGHIFDVDAYIASAHPDYDYENAFYIVGNYYKSSQFDTSVFYKYSHDSSYQENGIKSEGNCVLNAAYSSMLNAAKHGWNVNVLNMGNKNFNSTTILSDRLISTCGPYDTDIYRSENGITKTIPINKYKWGVKADYYFNGSFSIPTLYWHVRERAIDLKYYCDSFETAGSNVQDIYRHAYYKAGYNYPTVSNDGDACDNVIMNIKNNSIPGMVCTKDASVYGNHGMSIYGYKTYSVTKTVLWFTQKYYKYMFLVDDGHVDSGFVPVSDSAILNGNLRNNSNYSLSQKHRVRWYDPTCASSNKYYSISSSTMEHTQQ